MCSGLLPDLSLPFLSLGLDLSQTFSGRVWLGCGLVMEFFWTSSELISHLSCTCLDFASLLGLTLVLSWSCPDLFKILSGVILQLFTLWLL